MPVTRVISVMLAALFWLSAPAPVLAQSQPAEPAEPPAADSARPSHIVQPKPSAIGHKPPKQTKKMGHAGKKMSRHHGRRGRVGAVPGGDGSSQGQPAQPQ